MKKGLLLLAFVATAFQQAAHAQTSDAKNAIGVSAMYNDFLAPIQESQWFVFSHKTYGQEFSYSRFLTPSFNLRLPVSIGTVDYPYGAVVNGAPVGGYRKSVGGTLDAQLLYKFNNGYVLKEDAVIAPYVYLGVAAVGGMYNPELPKNYDVYLPFGAGLGFRLSQHIYLTTEAGYRRSIALEKHNFLLKAGVNFLFGKPADRDGDGVSDKDDTCPDTPGLAALKGCPDGDSDGIADKDDKCPTVAGLAAFNGCPDTDGDGITDADDTCPTVAGLAAFKGCPDTDGDGVTDAADKCPTVAGLAAFNGCPDTDGDGITDAEDGCPTEKGSKEMNGCPDGDGDGIADKDDKCPIVKGVRENNGCPAVVVDTDGDSIADKDDACPTVRGIAARKGCPADVAPIINPPLVTDTDGDGIADKDDKCPTEAGVKENFGCPIKKAVTFSFDNILFETGSAVLKPQSFATLDQVVTIMRDNGKHSADIQGHTDSQGNPAKNLALSVARAKTCLDYLVSKGIAASRLSSEGLGDKMPVADNKTADGRARNRRVEFKLSLK